MSVEDDDTRGVMVAETSDKTEVKEKGGADTYTVVLTSKPTDTVKIGVTSDDTDVARADKSDLTFTTTTWNMAQTVTVTGVDDDLDNAGDERTATITHNVSGGDYAAVTARTVTVKVTDDDTRGVTVLEAGGKAEVGEKGGTDTYTVVLTSKPTDTVKIGLTSGDVTAGTVDPSELTFTTRNWETAQTVTVTGMDDDVDNAGDERTATITHKVSGGDYAAVTAQTVTVTVTDDDAAPRGITLTASPDEVDEDDGAATVTVTAKLDGAVRFDEAKTVAVVVGKAADGATEGTDYDAVANFTIEIAKRAASGSHTFTLTPTDDTRDELEEGISVEGALSGVTVTGDSIALKDNDGTPEVTLALTHATIGESGATNTSTVTATLSGESSRDVTVTVRVAPAAPAKAGDYTVSGNTLTILAGTRASTGTVTITAVDNKVDNANRQVTVSGTVSDLGALTPAAPAAVRLTITDDDTRGVTVSETGGNTRVGEKGGTDRYTVVLTSEPTDTVKIGVESADTGAAAVDKRELTFTTSNWKTAQTVTVTGVDDAVDNVGDMRTATITHTVGGGGYATETAQRVTVVVTDDDAPPGAIMLTASPGEVDEDDGARTVTVTATLDGAVRFDEAKTVAVVVGKPSDSAVEGTDYETVADFSIEIAKRAARGTQTFTLTPADDTRDEEDESISVEGTLSGVTVMGDRIVLRDNDGTPEVTLMLAPASIDESGVNNKSTVTATLSGESSRAVTVTVAPVNAGDYTVSASKTLIIAAGSRTSTGTVTITAVNNDVDTGDREVTVTGTVSDLGALTPTGPAAVKLTIADDDEAGVLVEPQVLPLREGETGSYAVVLESEPAGDVTIALSVPPGADVELSPETLVFTASDWQTPKTVAVTAVQDRDAVDDPMVTLTLQVTGADYGDAPVPRLEVAIEEDDEVTPEEKVLVEDAVKNVAASAVANVSANIGARFAVPPGGAPALTLAGVHVGDGAGWLAAEDAWRAWPRQRRWLDDWEDGGDGGEWRRGRSVSTAELLRTSAFQVALGAADGAMGGDAFAGWTMWGRGDLVRLESDEGDSGSYDGRILAGYMGVDKRVTNQWTLGVAASRIAVRADYALEGTEGDLKLSLTGFHPYARFASARGMDLSVILGAGVGKIENAREGLDGRESADVRLLMAGFGGRRTVATGLMGGIDVALLGDLGYGRLSGESKAELQALDDLMIHTLRLRGGVEGSHTRRLDTGATLTPFVELAGRYDGGSGDHSTGVEVAGGVTYAVPALGVGLQARGNVLALSSRSDYQEYGASATLSLTPQGQGQGLSVSVTPRLGRPSGSADALWRDDPFALAGRSREPQFGVDARVEYGLEGLRFRGTVAPFTELQWQGDESRRVRAGVRMGRKARAGRQLDMQFYGERVMIAHADAEERLNLMASWRF